jgi:hypothetical protein
MERCVEAEWLDELPVEDPGALGSRRDLRVLNYCMGNARIVAHALISECRSPQPKRVIELGAGDGYFFLQVARQLGPCWKTRSALLVDRQSAVPPAMLAASAALGWEVEIIKADVFEWLELTPRLAGVAMVANLFTHHFDHSRLSALLRGIARHAQVFVAVEPRRSLWSLGFSKLVGIVGCNRVTRHDAPASVRAGFSSNELTQLWPDATDWFLQERRAGPFSHLFVAVRKRRSTSS